MFRWYVVAIIGLLAVGMDACGGGPSSGTGGTPSLPNPFTTQITVDASQTEATIPKHFLGANMGSWFDITQPGIAKTFEAAGIQATEWPGGGQADAYHWQTNTVCGSNDYTDPNSTFDNFMQDVALPAHLDVGITVNYGSNVSCTAGGDPHEAAAWVNYANNVRHYGIHYWTVGDEVYGSWEMDLHTLPHDAATYAQQVAQGYYPDIKAADPSAQVGITVAGALDPAWDAVVLKQAKYDFVQYDWYPEDPGNENDTYLLEQAPDDLDAALQFLRSEMNAAGVPASVPIVIGGYNSVSSNPGKQTVSIVNGLFAGMTTAELLAAGIPRALWWIGFGSCSVGNQSAALYGWQNFGSYSLFSDGTPEYGCPNAQTSTFDTPFPAARALQLLSRFAIAGNVLLPATVGPVATPVRAFAATQASGFAILLFNTNPTDTGNASLTLADSKRQSFSASVLTYGKAQYDQSQRGQWVGPVTQDLGLVSLPVSVVLPPWSIVLVLLQ